MADTCAVSVLIAFKWARADHELRVLGHGANREAVFLAINPAGLVPVVVSKDEAVLTETHALLLLLADSHPDSGLAPPSSRPIERYRLERLLAFMTGEVHAAFAPYFRPERYSDNPNHADAIRRSASRRVRPMLAQLDAALGRSPYLLGERTVADPFLYVLTRWARILPDDLEVAPNLAHFQSSMETDPAVIAALADHGMKPLGCSRRPRPSRAPT